MGRKPFKKRALTGLQRCAALSQIAHYLLLEIMADAVIFFSEVCLSGIDPKRIASGDGEIVMLENFQQSRARRVCQFFPQMRKTQHQASSTDFPAAVIHSHR